METDEGVEAAQGRSTNPRSVSRGLKLQEVELGWLGIDSLYVVLEYPLLDIYERYTDAISDVSEKRLYGGVVVGDVLVRRGAHGYKLSLWDGDARLYVTDRVDEALVATRSVGQGMGVMLQLGPKWLLSHSDIRSSEEFIADVWQRFSEFGIHNPSRYQARLNRIDIALDVIGLSVADFSVDDWRNQWVGYASKKTFFDSAITGKLEGLSIGSSGGAIRFKVYDKVAQSEEIGTSRFWRSVWDVDENDEIDVARFEWTIKAYQAGFSSMRYLKEFTFDGLVELLNYASLNWGKLSLPQTSDTNQSRWPMAPLWVEIRHLIEEWTAGHRGIARRDYEFGTEITPAYVRAFTGWVAGLMARTGVQLKMKRAASLSEALNYVLAISSPIEPKAEQKYAVLSKLDKE